MTQITGGALGYKALTLGDFDEFMDWALDKGGDTDPQELYKCVAWTFWCAQLIANCVAQIPKAYYPEDMDEDEQADDNQAEWDIDLAPVDWRVRIWLQLHGAAYVLKRANRVTVRDLQVLNANTMKVVEIDSDGRPSKFKQQIGSKPPKFYKAEEIVYFQTWSPDHDIGPGVSAGGVGAEPGQLVKNANVWASAFFANGAIPAVMLTTEGPVPPVEKSRIQVAWEKILKGAGKAHKTVVLERGLKPTIIGQPIKDLAMPDLERTKREQILAAHLIPPGLAEAKTNRAERDALQYELWTQTIKPLVNIHTLPAWNRQLFNPLGLRIVYQINKVEIIERAEIAKAESQSFLASGVVYPGYEANLVSVDEARRVINQLLLSADMPGLDEEFEQEDRITPPLEAQAQFANDSAPGAGNQPGQSPPPKALAPVWGHHRVSLPN